MLEVDISSLVDQSDTDAYHGHLAGPASHDVQVDSADAHRLVDYGFPSSNL